MRLSARQATDITMPPATRVPTASQPDQAPHSQSDRFKGDDGYDRQLGDEPEPGDRRSADA